MSEMPEGKMVLVQPATAQDAVPDAKEEQIRQAEGAAQKNRCEPVQTARQGAASRSRARSSAEGAKQALMQELTVAYRNNDMHTLLRLELEWIAREEGNLERLTDEKLAIYNQTLKEQVVDLQRELYELPCHPRYQPIAESDGPFGVTIRANGPAEARALDEGIASMEAFVISSPRAASRLSRRSFSLIARSSAPGKGISDGFAFDPERGAGQVKTVTAREFVFRLWDWA